MGKPLKKWIITTRIYRLWHREVDPNPSQQPKKKTIKKKGSKKKQVHMEPAYKII